MLDKEKLYRENMMDQIKREITIMRDLHHPNIVDLKEVMASKDKIYMVMEFMPGGELFDKIVADGPMEASYFLYPPYSRSWRLVAQSPPACLFMGLHEKDLHGHGVHARRRAV